MNYKVEYEINTINDFRKDIATNGNNLIEMLDQILVNIKDLEKCFDTPTSRRFKEKFIEYLEKEKTYVSNEYVNFGNIIDKVIKVYNEQQLANKKSVSGD